MRYPIRSAVFSFAIFMFATSAFAGLAVKDVRWQVAASAPGREKAVYADAAELTLGKDGKVPGRLRLVIRLENGDPKSADGRVIRCAFSMRVTKEGEAEGMWTVPFSTDERRVAAIGAGRTVEVMVPHTDLQLYLKRLANTGFKADRVRAEVMLEPRRGDTLAVTGAELALTGKTR